MNTQIMTYQRRWFTRLAIVFAVWLLASCATRPSGPDTYSFALIGDSQYSDAEELLFAEMRDAINQEPLAFVVHVGDIKAGGDSICTDQIYLQRRDEFNQFVHPFIYTTGDNDWVDCRRPSNGSMNPLERLEKVRDIFFATPTSLGQRTLALTRQSDARVGDPVLSRYRDNALWVHGGMVYVTLNVQGSNDNVGFDRANDAEQIERVRANLDWLQVAMNRARGTDIIGLVVALHANPGFELPAETVAKSAYPAFFTAFEREAAALGKPILFMHGDTHQYRVEKPYRSPLTKQSIANITRVESYGSIQTNWVRVTIDSNNRTDPFHIESGRFAPRPQIN